MTALLGRSAEDGLVATPIAAAPPPPTRSRRISGLDGLRAIAVSTVLIYHLGLGWLPGGFLGVDLFFVISGFLITTLLLAELERSGRISFGQFYLRRARRLLPALFAVLAATLVLVAIVARDAVHQTLSDVPGALLYVSNWWALSQEQSYFDLIGRGNLLGHLWSLAVEEQFYLIWPLFLGGLALIAARTGGRLRRLVLVVAIVGALASTIWMAVLAVGSGMPLAHDPTRVYFGSDTHAMSVLVGAGLAAVWNVRAFRSSVAPGARLVFLGAGVLGLAGSAVMFATITEYTPWLYRGGFLVAAGIFALVVAAVTHPASPLGPALDNPPMRWVGQRSYGIYLWHWPIFLVTRPGTDLPWDGPLVNAGRVALVLLVAEVSYRYLEVPIRRGALGALWARRRFPATVPGRVGLGAALASLCIVGGLLATAPTAQEVAAAQALGTTQEVDDTAGTQQPPGVGDITWYGDSVTLWAADTLRQEFPGVRIDAGINRSAINILSRVRDDIAAGTTGGIVVMHLGNAGPVSAKQLDETLTMLGDGVHVVLINSGAHFPYVAQANATVAEVAANHPNAVLVDWKADSVGHAGWFADGLHLTEAGKLAFAATVRAALDDSPRPEPPSDGASSDS